MKVGSQIMAWVFVVAVLTDVLDGYIARSWKMVTRLGKLLDPLADKLLVTTALIMMLAVESAGGLGSRHGGHHRGAGTGCDGAAQHRLRRGPRGGSFGAGQAQDPCPERRS